MTLAEEERLAVYDAIKLAQNPSTHIMLATAKERTPGPFVGTGSPSLVSRGRGTATTDVGPEGVEQLKDTLSQWRRKSSLGGAAIAREKAALTFDLLINFVERQPAEHCPRRAGRP